MVGRGWPMGNTGACQKDDACPPPRTDQKNKPQHPNSSQTCVFRNSTTCCCYWNLRACKSHMNRAMFFRSIHSQRVYSIFSIARGQCSSCSLTRASGQSQKIAFLLTAARLALRGFTWPYTPPTWSGLDPRPGNSLQLTTAKCAAPCACAS